jgi:hypothetical protein
VAVTARSPSVAVPRKLGFKRPKAVATCNCPRLPPGRRTGSYRSAVTTEYKFVGRSIGWLKGVQSITTGHEMLTINLAVVIKLAIMYQHLRAIGPSDRICDGHQPPIL